MTRRQATSGVSPSDTLVAVLATGAGLAAIVIDHVSADDGASKSLIDAGLAGAVTVGFAVLLFAWALPRAKRHTDVGTAKTALVTSVIACFSVASAWTGLPFVFGTGGAMLGTVARRGTEEPRQRGVAAFAVSVGILAVALACVTLAAL
jgi:hypothetical protein